MEFSIHKLADRMAGNVRSYSSNFKLVCPRRLRASCCFALTSPRLSGDNALSNTHCIGISVENKGNG